MMTDRDWQPTKTYAQVKQVQSESNRPPLRLTLYVAFWVIALPILLCAVILGEVLLYGVSYVGGFLHTIGLGFVTEIVGSVLEKLLS